MFTLLAQATSIKLTQQVAGLLAGLCLCTFAVAQISPAQQRDIESRNQQELLRNQQQEQQQRQQLERRPDVRLTPTEKTIAKPLPIETPSA